MSDSAWVALAVGVLGVATAAITNSVTYGKFAGRVLARLDAHDGDIEDLNRDLREHRGGCPMVKELQADLREHKNEIWPVVRGTERDVARIKGTLGINGENPHRGKGAGIV